VLCHGLTGMPGSLRAWGQGLADAGLTVRIPRLPGHGTRWQDLNDTRWLDWYGEVERALDELRGRCRQVFAMGLSMGGTLVLRLAEQRPSDVSGLVLVNPSLGTERKDLKYALPVLARFVPSVAGIGSDIRKPGTTELAYDRTPLKAMRSLSQLWPLVTADLGRITAPVLLFRSRVDHVVEPLSGRLLRDGATSAEVTEVILEESYHVATLDNDAPAIFAGSLDWVRQHTAAPAGG
jgi:carboxylesterase